MSDDPNNNLNDSDKERRSSTDDSKPNVCSSESSEPNTDPLTLSSAHSSSNTDKNTKTGLTAVLPGAVAGSTAADVSFKGNKYQRRITTSRGISSATSKNTVVSSSNKSTMNVTASSPPDNHVNNVLNASTITSFGDSELAVLTLSGNLSGTKKIRRESKGEQQPVAVQQSKGKLFHLSEKDCVARKCGRLENTSNGSQNSCSDKLATKIFNINDTTNRPVVTPLDNSEQSFLPDFIAGTHGINISDSHHANESHSFAFIAGSYNMNSSVSSHADESQSFSIFDLELLHDSERHDESSLSDGILLTLPRSFMFFIGCISHITNFICLIIIIVVVISIVVVAAGLSNPSDTPMPSRTSTLCPSLTPTTSNVPSFYPSLLALKALYDSTDGTNWSKQWDFISGQSYCNFYGIKCDGCNQITGIDLRYNKLRGSLPSEIGMLSSLTRIRLSSNFITGTIPSEIGMLSSLTILDFWRNLITGTIPTELCALTNTIIWYDESEISCICIDTIYREGTTCN